MKLSTRTWLVIATVQLVGALPVVHAQAKSDQTPPAAAASQNPKDANVQAYIDLLRKRRAAAKI